MMHTKRLSQVGPQGTAGPAGAAGPAGPAGGSIYPFTAAPPWAPAKLWVSLVRISGTVGNGTFAPNASQMMLMPFLMAKAATLDEVAFRTTVVGANARIGIYASDANGFPAAKLYDTGDIAINGAPGQFSKVGVALALNAGVLYWVAWVSTGAPTVKAATATEVPNIMGSLDAGLTNNSRSACYQNIAGTAMPDLAAVIGTIGGPIPDIFARFA